MKRFIAGFTLFVVFAATFGTAVALQHRGISRMAKNPPFYETWQFTGRTGAVMKVMALRYDLVFADFLWLRSIQSFGGRGMTNRDWKPLYNLFDSITELDPYFQEAYTFGNLVIGDEGGHQREGLALLHKGTFSIYKQYRIPFEGMYVSHWSLGDKDRARWYGRIASKRLDSPEWVQRVTAYIDVESGAYYIGYDRFVGNFLEGTDAKEAPLQSIALGKLKEAIDKWSAQLMLKAVDEYTSSTGQSPKSINDLAGMPSLHEYEIANLQKTVAAIDQAARKLGREGIDPNLLQPHEIALPSPQTFALPEIQGINVTGKTKLAQLQNVIFKASLQKISGLPPDPTGAGYALNYAVLSDTTAKLTEKVTSPKALGEFTTNLLMQYRQAIDERKAELGRIPKDLKEVFYTELVTPEPHGGSWLYDPGTGAISSSVRPDL